MVIGLKHGKARAEDEAAKQKTYELVRDFVRQFKERHGTITCRELINVDISTPEGLQAARDRQLFATICHPLVKDAVEMLEEILT